MGVDQQVQRAVEPAEQAATFCLIPFNKFCLLRIRLDLFFKNEDVGTDTGEEDVGTDTEEEEYESRSIQGTDYEDYELYEQ